MNNMYVDEIPRELSSLEKLEQILIAQRIVIEKIVVMPKGPPHRLGIIMRKLKRKLQFS